MNTDHKKTLSVLVEEEGWIRSYWGKYFQNYDWPLIIFDKPEDFLFSLHNLFYEFGTIHFYLDQDFGTQRGVGVTLAKEIKEKSPQSPVYLVTAYPACLFENEIHSGLLDYVYPKSPEEIFGELALEAAT